MKIKKIITEKISDLGYWLWPRILRLIIISAFIICSMMVGGLIASKWWIVFVADLVFYYLFWVLLNLFPIEENGKYDGKKAIKIGILLIVIIILFVFIAMATLGVIMVTSGKMLLNVLIFIIGLYITISIFMSRDKKIKNV